MTRRAFVDTHVHFNDMAHPELRWTWLEAGAGHPLISNPEGYKHLRYTAQEFAGEVRFSHVTKVVHVQAAIGTRDPVTETRWLTQMAADTGWPDAIIGEVALAHAGVERNLARQAEFPLLRGVRDLSGAAQADDAAFQRGYARLGDHGLIVALAPTWQQMAAVARLAARHPETLLVLEHTGMPLQRDTAYFASWQTALADIARLDNVVMKISGLGMSEPRWTMESIRPWVQGALEAFGTDRCVFGTNWPVDRLSSSYTDLVDAYAGLIEDLGEAEQTALFSGNAERWFGI